MIQKPYLYCDNDGWEYVQDGKLIASGTGTLSERLASLEDVQKYAGKSSSWIEAIPHILANSRESVILSAGPTTTYCAGDSDNA